MKKMMILTLSAFLVCSVCSFAKSEEIKWYSWNEGYELSKKENKPMLIFVHATWCNMCKRLEEKTFNSDGVVPIVTEKFIPVKLNAEEKIEYQLGGEKVSVGKVLKTITIDITKGLSVPTTVLWFADSKKGKVITGLLEPDQMKKALSAKVKK
jgi:thioredoxin-related protein